MVFLTRALKPFCLFLAVAISGCMVAQKLGLLEKSARFSHKVHSADEDLGCEDCHRTAAKSEDAGMPRVKQCLVCHEGIDEERSPAKKFKALYGEKPEWSKVTALPEEVIFSHQVHNDAKVKCGECHRGIERNRAVTSKLRVEKDACLKCHAKKGLAKDCKSCHTTIRKDREPGSHKHNWKKYHGQVVRADTGRSVDRCELCHQESACTACHQDEAPQNHNNHWRHRGHWVAASVDRENCAACHRSDFCDRCHRDSEPRNHVGLWSSPRNQHCLNCHFPLKNEGCITCHKSDPSHAQATALPTNQAHANATDANCRACHTPLSFHFDNGDSCRNCHE